MIRQTSLETNTFFLLKGLVRESITKAMMETQLHIFPLTEEAIFIIKQIDAFPLEGGECHTCLQGWFSLNLTPKTLTLSHLTQKEKADYCHYINRPLTSIYRHVPLLIENCCMMQRTLDKKAYFRGIKCRILSNIQV